jgi:hypothetical protein
MHCLSSPTLLPKAILIEPSKDVWNLCNLDFGVK